MANQTRQATSRVIELAEEGILTWEQVARDCMNYMSEDDVRDMAEGNLYFNFDEESVE